MFKFNKKIFIINAVLLVGTSHASQTLREAFKQTLTETNVLYEYNVQRCYQGPSTPFQCDPAGMRESMQFNAGSLPVSTLAASLVAQEQNAKQLKELGLRNNSSTVQLEQAPTACKKPICTKIALQQNHQKECQQLEQELGL